MTKFTNYMKRLIVLLFLSGFTLAVSAQTRIDFFDLAEHGLIFLTWRIHLTGISQKVSSLRNIRIE